MTSPSSSRLHTWWAVLCCAVLGCGGSNTVEPSRPDGGSVPANPTALRNVDVTVIFPLPVPSEWDALLRAGDTGRDGELLGTDVYAGAAVPELDERSPLADDAGRLAALRAVAVRVDPCPGVVMPPAEPSACRPQIRLVFQSLRADSGQTSARDGAIHAFYELSPADFEEVLVELRRLRSEHAADVTVPLGIQPWALAEGLRGAYTTRIRGLVTRFCGTPNLVRVTSFRRLAGDAPQWEFALRERPGSVWQDGIIPTTGKTREALVTIAGGRWDADITPAVSHPDDPTRVFRVQVAEEKAAFGAVGRLLDPRVHSSESVDCASCHIAPDVAQFGIAVRQLSLPPFASRYPLEVAARSEEEAIGFENVHMMSYFGTSFSVSPRVANETAAILEYLALRDGSR